MRGVRGIAATTSFLVAVLTAGSSAGATADEGSAVLDALNAAARLRGVEAPTVRRAEVQSLGEALTSFRASNAALTSEDLVRDDVQAFARLPQAYQRAVAVLAGAVSQAADLRHEAIRGVTRDEIATAERVAMLAQFAPQHVTKDQALAALSVVKRIDTAAMLRGAAILASAVEDAKLLVQSSSAHPLEPICTQDGSICVGSDRPDIYTEDVQLLVEPGGDDFYLNNAGGQLSSATAATTGGCVFGGGTTGRGRPNLDCSPAPGNVCTYDTLNRATGRDDLPVIALPGHDAPGSGSLNEGSCGSDARRERLVGAAQNIAADHDSRGVALLLDLDGSDTYTVPWSHEDPLFGLVEACYPGEAAKVNTNRDLFQGGALAGISVLWDTGDGADKFRGRLNAQGSGHVGGVGLLVAEGTGSNLFWADRLSQGNGIAGGVGLLLNTKAGDHTYLLDAPVVYRNEFRPNGRDCVQEGRAGQGEGGFAGVGVLWSSHRGVDTYRAVTHLTNNAYPFAPVLDADGMPRLAGGTDAQGSGESFPIPDTPGGLVVGAGLLFSDTDNDASVCAPLPDGSASAGIMTTGSTTSTGTDLSTAGDAAPCGTFNLPPEMDAAALDAVLTHAAAGAVGLRVVT